MRALWAKGSALLSAPLLAALLLGAGFMAFVGWDQSYWWRTKEDYSFGWLVPAFVAFVVYDRWPKILAAVQACAAPGSPRAVGAARWLLGGLAIAAMTGGVLVFLVGALYRAAAGASHPGSLALSLGTAAIVLSLIFFNAPAPGAAAPDGAAAASGGMATPAKGISGDARVKLALLFLFPALVWLVSAPMVSVVEGQLSLFLLHKVVTVVSFVFDVLGLPVEQRGNVLVLPNGSVGVEDACSGIRSLTGCLFAGSFLAAVFLDRGWKKVALVTAAMLFAFVTNLGRGLFLTAWAYNYGSHAIEGTVHDVAGYSVLGLTVVGLLCLLPLFNLKLGDEGEPAADGAVNASPEAEKPAE